MVMDFGNVKMKIYQNENIPNWKHHSEKPDFCFKVEKIFWKKIQILLLM